jgi:hypothetical protein
LNTEIANDDTSDRSKAERNINDKRIAHIWLSGNLSATLVIPIEIARRKGLDQPSNVIVEETEIGILIRKLEL